MKIKNLLIIWVILIATSKVHANIEENVYYQLYGARLEIAKIKITKQKLVVLQNEREFNRFKKFMEEDAISDAEFESVKLKYELSQIELEDLQARKIEANIMLDIAIDRIQIGLDIPICPGSLQ